MKLLRQRSAELGEVEKTCRTEQDVQLIFEGVGMEKKKKMEDGESFCRGYHISKLKVTLV